jgi:hypothetical protein
MATSAIFVGMKGEATLFETRGASNFGRPNPRHNDCPRR